MRLHLQECPACGISVFVKLFDDETGVRCVRCGATPIHLAVIDAIRGMRADQTIATAYEMSSRGALLKYLRKRIPRVVTSEFLDGVKPGTIQNGVRCEDVQKLSFASESFDLCTSTEVFEHVPDDMAGFAEVFRVLKQGGHYIFTVPIGNDIATVERARLVDGNVTHILPPTYHGDRIRGRDKVLVYRDYGLDICDRVRTAGFAEVHLREPACTYFGFARRVIVATK